MMADSLWHACAVIGWIYGYPYSLVIAVHSKWSPAGWVWKQLCPKTFTRVENLYKLCTFSLQLSSHVKIKSLFTLNTDFLDVFST